MTCKDMNPSPASGSPMVRQARVEVEHSCRIQGVAVLSDYELVVDGGQFPDVVELAEAAVLDEVSEIQVTFGTDKTVRRDSYGHIQTVNSVGSAKTESTANAQNTTAR
jgi:hypothetical protein